MPIAFFRLHIGNWILGIPKVGCLETGNRTSWTLGIDGSWSMSRNEEEILNYEI
jgi:hypothetical protein